MRLKGLLVPRSPLTQDELATITLNKSDKCYIIQSALLLGASPWFGAALKGNLEEAHTKEICFCETNDDVVEGFLHWLITRTIAIAHLAGSDGSSAPRLFSDIRSSYRFCIALWIFANEHLISDLQNAAMTEIHDLTRRKAPTIDIINAVYFGSKEGS